MKKLNKQMAFILFVVFLLTMPGTSWAQRYGGTPSAQNDWCTFGNNIAFLAGVNAFAFGLMPPLAPLGVIFGGVGLVTKAVVWANCK